MDNVVIKQLNSSDWRVYKTIQLEALKQDPQSFGSSYKEWVNYSDEKWQERPNNPDSMIFIAKDGATPIGLIGVYKKNDNEEISVDLWGIYVSPQYRRRGIGKRLMERALESIKNIAEIKKIKLMVNSQELPAIQLYKKLGFEKIGKTDYVLGDGKKYKLDIMEKIKDEK